MGRIRTIKPEFFLHEELFDLEAESGLPVRLAFAGLFCQSDREGRFQWHPRKLKTQILPYDDVDFSRVLDALTTRGFVVKYTSHGCVFGAIPSFTRHQVINNREGQSEIPAPSISDTEETTSTRAARVNNACTTESQSRKAEGKGREGKGKERKEIGDDRKNRFIKPTIDQIANYCRERGNKVDPQAFLDHYTANGWRVGKNPMRDWMAAVRTWEKNSLNGHSSNGHSASSSKVATAEDLANWNPVDGGLAQ